MTPWIEKQRYIIDFTISSLLRRKVKNIGLLTLYTLIVFILASTMFFTHSIKKEAAIILQGSPEIVVQKIIAGRHDLFPISYIDSIKSIRGIANVETRLWGYYYDSLVGANYTLLSPPDNSGTTQLSGKTTAVETDPDDAEALAATKPLFEYNGALLEPGTLIIGNGVSRMRNISKGDYMPFMAADGQIMNLKVSGTLSSSSELVSSDLILITDEDFRKLFGIAPQFVTDAIVTVKNPNEVSMVAGKIKKRLLDSRPIIRDEILRTYDSIFNWRGGMMIVIFSAAVLAFVIFAWDKASGLSAGERREIGILKAVGWETSDVIQMKFWEGAMISLTAFFTGVILAYIHVFFAGSPVFEPALKGWSSLYPNFALTPFINAEQITTLFFLTVVPYTVATIVPTWRAATIDPDSAMRQTGE
ncbi:ABC transporter permease [Methylicorpusculum sp.]|uniref:ABC transporter permease n=1 Tax=Methylicorpusculum sp. TaxID=2713644 RepID=UPI00271A3DDF|nr:FtsX-like permease family protein [Methylicorpusculum sp.]MDO8843805.1 FtsX-like permease family protein [Methylicorpusculum sp.]MDP2178178.1 FtsX-like permease family protein [Methylicorpusculum sp.]MDP3530493.1 FtsX-like permease family protein [Methylicorpusculum sp.]MDZ4153223.1 FtsX-like permease family protein [Methylicorpusculum sp.]